MRDLVEILARSLGWKPAPSAVKSPRPQSAAPSGEPERMATIEDLKRRFPGGVMMATR
jgi:hypothetical protein